MGDGYTAPRAAVTSFPCPVCLEQIAAGDAIRFASGPDAPGRGAWMHDACFNRPVVAVGGEAT